jgi:adenylosuccinate lyase
MKKCRNCQERFNPIRSTLEKYCQKDECIRAMVCETKEKLWKQTKKKMKEDLMTVQDYIKVAQQVFNKFIRLRDQGKNCISCGLKPKKENAGHFYSAGTHTAVRFDERNVHLQCEHCNSYLSGNLLKYRDNILTKLGYEEFESLTAEAMKTRKYTREELKEIIQLYKTKIKEMEKNNN